MPLVCILSSSCGPLRPSGQARAADVISAGYQHGRENLRGLVEGRSASLPSQLGPVSFCSVLFLTCKMSVQFP